MLLNQIIAAINGAISARFTETTAQIIGLTLPATTEDKQPLNIDQNTFEDMGLIDGVEVNIFHRAAAIEYEVLSGKGAGHKYRNKVTVSLVCQSSKPRVKELLEEILSSSEHVKLSRANLNGEAVHKEFKLPGEYNFSKELFSITYIATCTNEPCNLKF